MARILVTGSEGSLMQAVIPYLKFNGDEVFGVDSLERYGKRRYIAEANYPFLRGDLTDPYFVDDVFEQAQPEYVIQAAAKIYGVGGFHAHPAEILSDDVVLQSNMLKASQTFGIQKFIYISSSMVYETVETHPSREGSEENYPTPRTDYGLSKLMGERLVQAFFDQYKMPYTIWRPFNIITPFEPFEKEQGVSHVFADFINNIVMKGMNPLPIIGNGNQVRCFTWIDDVAQAIANYSLEVVTDNQTYNIGNPEPVTMKDLALEIYSQANDGTFLQSEKPLEFLTVKDYNDDVQVRIPDISKLQALGWEPKYKLKDSINECLSHLALESADTSPTQISVGGVAEPKRI